MNEKVKLESISDDDLVSELWARDVRFLMPHSANLKSSMTPEYLISALAQSNNARVRFSLIPLFLRHPEFYVEAEKADKLLNSNTSQHVLRFYYTAAVHLQKKYHQQLKEILGNYIELPDLFSKILEVDKDENPESALVQLGKRHQVLSGRFVNWIGTYEHAADVWLKQMELQKT